ncbi:Malate dehydrogenase [Klebsiella aerogenes]|nr:Malate dehydrogenase [Klebsiella aerogenes]
MPTGHRFLATDLHQFVVSLFTHLGSTPGEATLVADHLIAANLAGHDSHGVGMIPSYVKSHAGGFLQLNRHATVTKDAGAVVTLDGNAGFGQVVAHEAMQLGIEKAKQHGMAAIALRQCASRRTHRLLGRTVRRRRADLHSLRQRHRRPDGRPVPREGQPLRHQPAVRGVSPRGPSAAAAGLRHQRHRLW